jgi:hypothetical protein
VLTVTGVVVVASTPSVVDTNKGGYYNFTAVSKNPYKGERKWYSLSVFVPKENLPEAAEKLAHGKCIQIRIGELDGRQVSDGKFVAMQVKSRWSWLEPLGVTPTKE